MNRVRNEVWAGLVMAVAAAGCADPTNTSQGPVMSAAKAPAAPSVQAADPAYGYEGDAGKVVTITGSGFDAGSRASWERNGAPDPKIAVVSTQFLSSSQLRATINIASSAELTFYDIAVTTSKGRKGIGTELFEVTQAVLVSGTSILRGVNDNGDLGGSYWGGGPTPSGARFYNLSVGLLVLPEVLPDGGGVWAIDEAGRTMSGYEGGAIGVTPVWTLVAGVWQYGTLPDDPAAIGGHGRAIASETLTGEAAYIAGHENFKGGKGNGTIYKPRLWRRVVGGWERVVLPSLAPDGSGIVQDITPAGVAVGNSNGRAVIWEPDGSGGWTIAYLPGTVADATGINSAGTLIGGGSNAYWTRPVGGSWTLAFLPLACNRVTAVDDLGRIGAGGCPQEGRISRPAIFSPPYTAPPIFLGSFGPKGGGNLEKMSLNGSWIAGQINTQGVYWKVF